MHELDAPERRMHMGIMKSGQDHASTEFEDLAPKAAEHLLVGADGGDVATPDRHCLSPRLGFVQGVHPACAQDQVRRLRRWAATRQQRGDGQQSEWSAHDGPL